MHVAQLIVSIGGDSKLMTGGPPVLQLSTTAVHVIIHMGGDDQLTSGGRPSYSLIKLQ